MMESAYLLEWRNNVVVVYKKTDRHSLVSPQNTLNLQTTFPKYLSKVRYQLSTLNVTRRDFGGMSLPVI